MRRYTIKKKAIFLKRLRHY